MRTIDAVVGWLLIALGVVHLAFTPKADPNLGLDAIWFASGGLFMMAVGALDLLRVAYASVARGVRAVSVIANIALLLLITAIATRLPMRSNPQVSVAIVLAALLTAFSIFRRTKAQTAKDGMNVQ